MIMKIIAFLLLCFFFSVCSGQNFTPPRSSASITVQDSRMRPLLTFYLPHTHGLTLNGGLDTLGALLYEDSSGHVWYRDTVLSGGKKWVAIGVGQTWPQTLANGRSFSANDSAIFNGHSFHWKGGRQILDSFSVGIDGPMLGYARFGVPNYNGAQYFWTLNYPGSDTATHGFPSPFTQGIDGSYVNPDGQRDWVGFYGYNTNGGSAINANDMSVSWNMETYYQPSADPIRGDFEIHNPEVRWPGGYNARLQGYTIKTDPTNRGVGLNMRGTTWSWQSLFTNAPVFTFGDGGGFSFIGKPASSGTIISLSDSAATAYYRMHLIPGDAMYIESTLPINFNPPVVFGNGGNDLPMKVIDHSNNNGETTFLFDLSSTNSKTVLNMQGAVDGVLTNSIQNLSTVSGAHNELHMDVSGANHNQIRFGNLTSGKYTYLTSDSSSMLRILRYDGLVHTNFEIDPNDGTSIGEIAGTTDNSAYLQVQGTAKGFLPPVLTTTQRNAVSSPATGLHVAQSDTLGAMGYYNGTAWQTYADRNWVRAGVAAGIKYLHTIFTPTTGATVNLVNGQYNIINPAGALLALTVNLPSSPANNDVVFIKFTQTVTTVTYANGTVVDGITGPAAGGLVVLTYDSGTTSWY